MNWHGDWHWLYKTKTMNTFQKLDTSEFISQIILSKALVRLPTPFTKNIFYF